jgi:hypothetical protein
MDGFKLETPPKHSILGFNPHEEITKLENQKLGKDEKEIKKLDKEIEYTRKLVDRSVKVIFEFNDKIKKLIYVIKLYRNLPLHTWCGILDFSIKHPIIFGRVSKYVYRFGPFEELKSELYEQLETIEDKFPHLFPYKIIESDPLIDLLQIEKHSDNTLDDLRRMIVYNVKENEDSPLALINGLNRQKKLINLMKKIPHYDLIKRAYDVDVINELIFKGFLGYKKMESEFIARYISTICIPYKDVTYFLIDQFNYSSKKQCRAIYSLINALKEFDTSEYKANII